MFDAKSNHIIFICRILLLSAVRVLASISMLMSRGFPWIVYNQAADTWWNPACDGLIDKNDKPKQVLAALETVISYFANGKS